MNLMYVIKRFNFKLLCVCTLSHVLLFWPPSTGAPPGSSVHGMSQARRPEWVAIASPGDLPDLGIEPIALASPVLAGGLFTTSATKHLDITNWLE